MTVEELIKIVRTDFLDKFSEVFISNNDLMIRSFSEAQKQACNRTDFIFDDTQTITLADGQSSYSLSGSIVSVEQVIFEDAFVELTSRDSLDHNDSLWRTHTGMTGKPVKAAIKGHTIWFIPKPDLADAGKTVSLEGYKQPPALTAITDAPSIPEEYHRDLIHWVLWEAYNKLKDINTANYYLSLFDNTFGRPVSSEQRLIRMNGNRSLFIRRTAPQTGLTRDSDTLDWD